MILKLKTLELKTEKGREFQGELSGLLIYYCSNGGKNFLPIDEELFLTAVVCGLYDMTGIHAMAKITPYYFNPRHWGEDVEEVLSDSMGNLMSDNSWLPQTLYKVALAIKKILDLEWDLGLDGEYRSFLMTIFKNTRDSSGYSGKTWRVSSKTAEDVEKRIIPNLDSKNINIKYFIKIMAEKTKGCLKRYQRKNLA